MQSDSAYVGQEGYLKDHQGYERRQNQVDNNNVSDDDDDDNNGQSGYVKWQDGNDDEDDDSHGKY